jgi:SsrA-binding protein
MFVGIVLLGYEVVSIRNGRVNLTGSFATIQNNELWLNNMNITPLTGSKSDPVLQTRNRKLLIHKAELNRLVGHINNGSHLVVLSIGKSGRFIKVELGIGRSKKIYDKRQTIKRRQANREAAKVMKYRNN